MNPNPSPALPRRDFLRHLAVGSSALALGPTLMRASGAPATAPVTADLARKAYSGPNLVIVRWGGGARRKESIEAGTTYSPFLCHELLKRGTLYKNMEITKLEGLNTSHGEGTLNIMTGHYDRYKDIENGFLRTRFEPKVPTIFEYMRKAYDVPDYQTLIVNNENRPDEEFYNFSNHLGFGMNVRSQTLSLYRYKTYLFQKQLAEGKLPEKELKEKRDQLAKWRQADARAAGKDEMPPKMEEFWMNWRGHYGDTGFVNERGDRLLTQLTIRAMTELKPKMVMVNYTDCDYVHWGYLDHYTRGIAIMDEGLRQLVAAVEADETYRDNTIFAVIPDCGRDNNPYVDVPCQHHFNSRSSHEIFALLFGPGIAKGQVVDKLCDQSQLVSTLGKVMKFETTSAESRVLEEAIA